MLNPLEKQTVLRLHASKYGINKIAKTLLCNRSDVCRTLREHNLLVLKESKAPKEFKVELKNQNDIHIVVMANNEAEAEKKVKKLFRNKFDADGNIMGTKVKIKKIHQGE